MDFILALFDQHILPSHKQNDFSNQELTYIWELLSNKSLFPSLTSSQNSNLYWYSRLTQSDPNASFTYGQFYMSIFKDSIIFCTDVLSLLNAFWLLV